MKISRFASIVPALLILAGIPCLAADGTAPDASSADTGADAPVPAPQAASGGGGGFNSGTTPQAAPRASAARGGARGGRGFAAQPRPEQVYFQFVGENEPDSNEVRSLNASNGGSGTSNIDYKPGMTLTQLIKDEHERGLVNTDAITKVWIGHGYTPPLRGYEPPMTLVDYAALKAGQAQDVLLAPGDKVKVQMSFVHLAVQSVGREPLRKNDIPYKEGMTVMQLVQSEVKDIKWMDLSKVDMGHLYIGMHAIGLNDAVVPVDYAAIASGQAKDIPLTPGIWVRVGVKPFVFDGGTPGQVIKAVEDFFGVDLSMADIPAEMADAQVPKFRIEVPTGANDVMQIYNQLGAKIPALGQWLWENKGGGLDPTYFQTPPGLLMLVPDKSMAATDAEKRAVKARAISIANIPANKWHELQNDIISADDITQNYIRQTGGSAVERGGTVQLQDDSKILIAIGIPSFIELAESVVAAYEKNYTQTPPPVVGPSGKGPNPSPPAK